MRNILQTVIFSFLLLTITCSQADKLRKLSKITVYYDSWNIDYFVPQTCERLKLSSNFVEIENPGDLKAFRAIFGKTEFVQLKGYDDIDVRICCILYDNTQNVITNISFDPTSLMEMDGRVYHTDSSLFAWVLSYMPKGYLDS